MRFLIQYSRIGQTYPPVTSHQSPIWNSPSEELITENQNKILAFWLPRIRIEEKSELSLPGFPPKVTNKIDPPLWGGIKEAEDRQ